MEKEQFKDLLNYTISAEIIGTLAQKEAGKKYLSYADAKAVTHKINNLFIDKIGSIPKQIDAACCFANAILAPSKAERERLIKHVKGTACGISGVALILAAIATALGWSAGVQATIIAWFVGSSLLGPIGWGLIGVTLTCVAGYFFVSNNEEAKTERYEKVLSAGVLKAVDLIWGEHKESLSKIKVKKG